MLCSSALEIQVLRGLVALMRDLAHQRLAAAIEIGLHPDHFVVIFVMAASFEARCKAHLHFRVDASEKCGIGMQIVDASAHLEKIERVVGELLGRSARRKGSIVKRTSSFAPKACGNRSAWIFVIEVKLDQCGKAQAKSTHVSLWELGPQDFIKKKSRLKIRPRFCIFDPAHNRTHIEPL